MSAETKTERVLRDVLNSDNLRDFLSEDVVNNAMKWRFLQAALYVLDGHGLLGDPDVVKDATPAPLDPSKVKAGDTVTLTKGETSVRGPVTGISYAGGGEWDFRVGEEPYRRTGRIGLWAVTDHQPAPEPEPEWKPGTVAEATVRGAKGIRVIRATNTGGSDPHEMDPTWISADLVDRGQKVNGYDGTYLHHDDDVTDVRPLVVIDPAAVDVDALTTTFHNASHYGVDLPLEGAAHLARVARTFFVGGES